ncbi:MAG: P-loop NTPase [Candidatus Methylomirabilales bacterium]
MAIPERELDFAALHLDEPETLKHLKALMAPVEFKVAVTGTRPGVGVSTFTLNMALALRHAKLEDSDFELERTPTIGILNLGGSAFPQRLGPERHGLERRGSRLLPARGVGDVKVVSLDMLMGDRFREGIAGLRDWSVVQGSLGQVDWGELDLLLIEFPSGIEAVEDLSEVLPAIDAALIVSRPGEGERERIRSIWKFFDASSVPAIGLVSNLEGRFRGEDVEDLGQTFGIPIRVAIPYEPALASAQDGATPYLLAHKEEAKVSRIFFDLSDDLVDYLVWLHDEHEQEEEF